MFGLFQMLCNFPRGAVHGLISEQVGNAHDSLFKAGQISLGEGLGLTLDPHSGMMGEPLSWGMPS